MPSGRWVHRREGRGAPCPHLALCGSGRTKQGQSNYPHYLNESMFSLPSHALSADPYRFFVSKSPASQIPSFLHYMEVSEEGFQALKVEQSILVTFAQFPENLIALLEECIGGRGQERPKFLAVLRLGDVGELEGSRLGIVETNESKHLSHISLSLKPGNDAIIKQFLAGRLMDLQCERDHLIRSSNEMSSKLGVALRELETSAKDLLRQKSLSSKAEETTQAKLDELSANLKLASLKELESTKKKLEGEHHTAQVGMRSMIESLKVRNAELDKQVHELMDNKHKLDSQLSDVSSRACSTEKELLASREEVARLQKINDELNKVRLLNFNSSILDE